MGDMWDRMSGVDMRREVAMRFGLASGITAGSGNAVTVREDDSLSGGVVEKCLNKELREWWLQIAEINNDRIATSHAFSFPASVECVALSPGDDPSVYQMDPPLPRPWYELRTLEDVTTALSPTTIRHVQYEQFMDHGGTRWCEHAGRLYLADTAGNAGIGSARSVRLHYVAGPIPISVDSHAIRTDIPPQMFDALVLGAVLKCLSVARVTPKAEDYARLDRDYQKASALAVRSVTRTTTRSQKLEWNEAPMTETW